jgi:hypothetical protein
MMDKALKLLCIHYILQSYLTSQYIQSIYIYITIIYIYISDLLCVSSLYNIQHIIEGSLEVKLPTIWTDEKQSRGREKRKIRRKKSRRERVRRKKMQMREKVGKSRNTVFFQ